MKKKLLVKYVNGYGCEGSREFDDAESYLEWIRNKPELFNIRNDEYLKILKITTIWLPLDWRDLYES